MKTTSIKDVSPKAVLLGAVTDIVATNIAMIPVAIIVFAQVGTPGATSAQQTAAFTAAIADNAWLYLAAMVLGCAASVLGGWVAARIARRAELLNGMIVGSVFFCVLGLMAGTLLLVAGRRLRAGRPSHWAFHGGALAVAAIPVALLLL